jgi:hypothetical protein
MNITFDEVFKRAAEELFGNSPPGQRTYMNMFLLLNNKYGNDPETMEVVRGFFQREFEEPDMLFSMMEDSDCGFDLYYPEIRGKVKWHNALESIGWYREDFSSMAFDNPFLKERLLGTTGADEIFVQPLPGFGERGNRFMVVDLKGGVGYSVKPYQGGWFEKQVMLAFSDSVGPHIYSAGERSFVEELMLQLNIPNTSTIRYFTIYDICPEHIGEVAAHVFAALHSCNVIFDTWNWHDEVRLKVWDGKTQSKIIDFGSSYIWPKRDHFSLDAFRRDTKTFQELKARDLRYVSNSISDLYPTDVVPRILECFQNTYDCMSENYSVTLAPIKDRLAALEPPK